METLDRNFVDFLKLLNSHEVEYLVIGGYAVGYHGCVRATGDLDIFVGGTRENAQKLVKVFRKFGFDAPALAEELFMAPGKIVRIGVPPLRVEVMNQISGVFFTKCYKERLEEIIGGVRICFIDRKSLLKNKRAAGRPKDLADLEALTKSK